MATATPTVETIKKITGVTLTLTLEEAVYLATFIGGSVMAGGKLTQVYNSLDDALGGKNDYPNFRPNKFIDIVDKIDEYIADMKTSL